MKKVKYFFALSENPLVCTEKVHMLQDGVGMYIPTSEDLICGGKPKMTPTTSTSTTTTEATPVVPAFQVYFFLNVQLYEWSH